MPDVRLTLEEAASDLPEVCMCCGVRATDYVERTFLLHDPVVHGPSGFWEIHLIRHLIATAQTPRIKLRTSFCPKHRNYWTLRAALLFGGLAGLLVVLLGGFAILIFLLGVLKFDAPWLGGIVICPVLVYLIAWLVPAMMVQARSIRARFAPDGTRDVILHNVDAGYAEALKRHRSESRPERREAPDSHIPETPSTGITDGQKRGRKGATAGLDEDRRPKAPADEAAAVQSVAGLLTKGSPPVAVEAYLVDSGWDAQTAQTLVGRVLEEMPGFLKARYTWQLYASLGLLGLALLVALVLSITLLTAAGPVRGLKQLQVLSFLWVFSQGYWSAVSLWKVWLAQRLTNAREAWLHASATLPGEAAPAQPSQEDGSSLVRRAIEAHDTQLLRKLGLGLGGSAVLLLVLGCCVILPIAGLLSRSRSSDEVSQPQTPDDPNAPDPDEGPPPDGWTVLFRSDDPTIWNTDSPGKNFALPVRRAHSKVRYLRLKRMETDDVLIVPIAHRQLARGERPDSFPGHWWIGTARQEWGARHLGIAQAPSAGQATGLIGLDPGTGGVWSGSGFGWKIGVNDQQYCCWQGREIPRTAFEVAVKANPLTEEERRRFTGPDEDDGPPPDGWTVLFRSDDPSVWNTFSTGEQFAVPVGRAHSKVRYLRLKRMSTGEELILPITRGDLAREPSQPPEKGFAWCGNGKLEYGARHLGILQAPRERFPVTHKRICVMAHGWDAYHGSGFGHMTGVDKGQFYSWKGQEIPRTAFEIAVAAGPLTEDEKRRLLRGH